MRLRRGLSYAAIAAALIAPWEGLELTAKPDRLAYDLPTVCYGMTPYDRPVKVGDHYTPQQCMDFLILDIEKYKAPLDGCVKVPLSNHQWAAVISGAYNAGTGAMCRSEIVRRLNARDPKACDAFRGWHVHAGGKYVRGLANRREAERKVCYQKD